MASRQKCLPEKDFDMKSGENALQFNTPQFYASREQRERDFAAKALSPAIAGIHLEWADRYATLQIAAMPLRQRKRSNGVAVAFE